MGKKTGRPPQAIKQEKFVGYYVTNAQYLIIQQKAMAAKVNISDYMRQVAVFGYVKPRWTAEEREIYKKMVGMSNQISDMAAQARKEGILSVMYDFTKYRDLIDEVINRLCHDE